MFWGTAAQRGQQAEITSIEAQELVKTHFFINLWRRISVNDTSDSHDDTGRLDSTSHGWLDWKQCGNADCFHDPNPSGQQHYSPCAKPPAARWNNKVDLQERRWKCELHLPRYELRSEPDHVQMFSCTEAQPEQHIRVRSIEEKIIHSDCNQTGAIKWSRNFSLPQLHR